MTSDRAKIFTRYSRLWILIIIVAWAREAFPGLFYRTLKNARFLVWNPALGFCITFWRKTKVIFGISSSSCIRPCTKRAIFVEVTLGEIWPKLAGLTENPVLGIYVAFWRKTKVIFGISASNHIEWYVALHIFKKKRFFEKRLRSLQPYFQEKCFS